MLLGRFFGGLIAISILSTLPCYAQGAIHSLAEKKTYADINDRNAALKILTGKSYGINTGLVAKGANLNVILSSISLLGGEIKDVSEVTAFFKSVTYNTDLEKKHLQIVNALLLARVLSIKLIKQNQSPLPEVFCGEILNAMSDHLKKDVKVEQIKEWLHEFASQLRGGRLCPFVEPEVKDFTDFLARIGKEGKYSLFEEGDFPIDKIKFTSVLKEGSPRTISKDLETVLKDQVFHFNKNDGISGSKKLEPKVGAIYAQDIKAEFKSTSGDEENCTEGIISDPEHPEHRYKAKIIELGDADNFLLSKDRLMSFPENPSFEILFPIKAIRFAKEDTSKKTVEGKGLVFYEIPNGKSLNEMILSHDKELDTFLNGIIFFLGQIHRHFLISGMPIDTNNPFPSLGLDLTHFDEIYFVFDGTTEKITVFNTEKNAQLIASYEEMKKTNADIGLDVVVDGLNEFLKRLDESLPYNTKQKKILFENLMKFYMRAWEHDLNEKQVREKINNLFLN